MNAVIPLHISALRVSATDATNVVSGFKGRTACFDKLPYRYGEKGSSTGDALIQPLESKDSPLAALRSGIHLHWELPDYFKKGVQSVETGKVLFPQVPNRWLVTRYLNKYDTGKKTWLSATTHSWVVESDFISVSQPVDPDGFIRDAVPVPLPQELRMNEPPYRYMGRAVDASEWPSVNSGNKYLGDYKDTEGNPFYLNALGFIGPSFSAYYPDCCSVFGFHDRFLDDEDIHKAIRDSLPVQFKVSYHIVGWIDGLDPCDGLKEKVTHLYEQYVTNCRRREEPVEKTPADFFIAYTHEHFGWKFNPGAVSYELDERQHLSTLKVPEKSLCNGIVQEIIWDMLHNPGISCFLGNPSGAAGPVVWKDDSIRLSLGNTSAEALAALLRKDCSPENELQYEYLLNLLQSGRIEETEKGNHFLSRLEEGLHKDSFSAEQGGLCWIIRKKKREDVPPEPIKEIDLPVSLSRNLSLLNQVQKQYNVGGESLEVERKQFFMDWFRYVKIFSGNGQDYPVSLNNIIRFIQYSFYHLSGRGENTGILSYIGEDGSGVVNRVLKPEGTDTSQAFAVWKHVEICRTELQDYPEWELLAIPAETYYLPTDPVIAIEVDGLKCKERNEGLESLPVRTSTEVIGRLEFVCRGFEGFVEFAEITGLPVVYESLPYSRDIRELSGEVALIVPSFVSETGTALAGKGGINNPAKENPEAFLLALSQIQGGKSALEKQDSASGLFSVIRQETYLPHVNPRQYIQSPLELEVVFTNNDQAGWIMHPVGWNTQEHHPELHTKRYDPFIPLFIVWDAKLEPVKRDGNGQNYTEKNLTDYFSFNQDATDYTYSPGIPFTDDTNVIYTGSSILMKKAIQSVTERIDSYAALYLDKNALNETNEINQELKARKIITQTLSGFSANTILRTYIPKMQLVNLTVDSDSLTNEYIREGLEEAEKYKDSWHAESFNAEAAVSAGPFAQNGFCPLRSGFLAIDSLEVIDVFGQRMQLSTPGRNSDGSLSLQPSVSLSPVAEDTRHIGKAYFPPRLLAPSRLQFEWAKGESQDLPGCGWIIPNHLDVALFFYNSDGSAIGSLGMEHHTLRYRTRAGNRENPTDSMEADIGTEEQPKVDRWLARFMYYIVRKSMDVPHFLVDLMHTILRSENYISPGNEPGDNSLAVLTGRPLALVRSVLGFETYGATLPLCQSGTKPTDPWPEDISNKRYLYPERMKYSAADIQKLQIPVRLGDRYDTNDGLIGYLIESNDPHNPYETRDLYAPAATGTGKGVVRPPDTAICLCPNAEAITLTLLVDPRAPVYALTGLLPVRMLEYPPDHFSEAVRQLHMTFFTHPLLLQHKHFAVPLPGQKGYDWSWVSRHSEEDVPLSPVYSPDDISWGYTPQRIEEGWLRLSPGSGTELKD